MLTGVVQGFAETKQRVSVALFVQLFIALDRHFSISAHVENLRQLFRRRNCVPELGCDLLLLTILRVPTNRLVSKPKYDLHHHVSRDALRWQRIVHALNQLSPRKPE